MKAVKAKKEAVRPSPVQETWNDLQEQGLLAQFKVPLMMMQDLWDQGRKREVHQGLNVLYRQLR